MQEVAVIKSWINNNASPFAWQRILFKLLPEFKKEGFFFHTIKDDSELSPNLLEKISEALFDAYKIKLSSDFFPLADKNKDLKISETNEETLITTNPSVDTNYVIEEEKNNLDNDTDTSNDIDNPLK
ncbi:hypothetical protein [Bernardetia sp.]|uniref:hypothetical protein n=1 Tax=Bernardetia sp. TaxID=1937974 RepID=UPI0025C5BCC4|nr:hypothetical protein [Bernardetia sp.]